MPYDSSTIGRTYVLPSARPRARAHAPKKLMVADLFCGAGGASTGARRALRKLGYDMDLVAVNHWTTAISTHSANHPTARHYNINLDAARPTDLVPEGKLDLLMASPECIHFSRARGGKPMKDQSRMSAWHIHRWATELRIKRLLIENVPEFTQWGPLNPITKRPVESRKGEYFRGFCSALEAIGYKIDWRILDAADYGDATNRKRFFLIARCDGKPLRWPEPTHCANPDADLFGAARKPWRTAREVIDRSRQGRSILYDRKNYSPKTISRIKAGLRRYNPTIAAAFAQAIDLRYGGERPTPGHVEAPSAAEPSLVMMCGSNDARSIDRPMPTATAGGNHIRICAPHLEPFALHRHGDNDGDCPAHSQDAPKPAITNPGTGCLVEPSLSPFIVPQFGEREGQAPRTHSIDAPLPAVTGHGAGALVEPFIFPLTHSGGDRVRSFDQPLPTITGANRGDLGYVEPLILDIKGGKYVLDLRFRMLEPDELAAAMGFNDDDTAYEFTGTKTERVKQVGNAVPVNLAASLVEALCSV